MGTAVVIKISYGGFWANLKPPEGIAEPRGGLFWVVFGLCIGGRSFVFMVPVGQFLQIFTFSGLDAQKLFQGAVVLAVVGGLETVDIFAVMAANVEVLEGEHGAGGGVMDEGVLRLAGDGEVDAGGIDGDGAGETPAGDGHVLDEVALDGGGGEELVVTGAEEGFETVFGFAAEDDELGEEAVRARGRRLARLGLPGQGLTIRLRGRGGVKVGVAFAFGGAGAGGFLGAGAVGCEFA